MQTKEFLENYFEKGRVLFTSTVIIVRRKKIKDIKMYRYFFLIIIIQLLVAYNTNACESFTLKKDGYVLQARTQYRKSECILIVNKRHVSKIAFGYLGDNPYKPISWISKYGSITLCQYGKETAFGGMNEEGLVINDASLGITEYPLQDERPSIDKDQLIQYILDNYALVEDIVKNLPNIRIRSIKHDENDPPHYFITDRNGESLLIQIIKGKYTFYTGDSLPIKGITNSEYQESLIYYKSYGFKGNNESSLGRFTRLAQRTVDYNSINSGELVDYAIKSLEYISKNNTKISVVFDITKRLIYFYSYLNNNVRYVDLKKFSFNCEEPSLYFDISNTGTGDISNLFEIFTTNINYKFIKTSWERLGINIYMPALDEFSKYPETTFCTQSIEVPKSLYIKQNYPNPFNSSTKINYGLSNPSFISLKIYNILGQEIATLLNNYHTLGEYEINWHPNGLSSGIYYYIFHNEQFTESKKMIYLK